MKEVISTTEAPAGIGPYSQAVKVDGTLYCSGQIAIDPQNGELLQGTLEEEARQVFKNVEAVLKAAGMGFQHVVKASVFIKNMGDFDEINGIYAEHFKEPFPARETVEVARLPKDVRLEISVIAVEA